MESHNQRIGGNLPHAILSLGQRIVLATYINSYGFGIGKIITECCAQVRVDLGILVTLQIGRGTCGLGYDTHLLALA